MPTGWTRRETPEPGYIRVNFVGPDLVGDQLLTTFYAKGEQRGAIIENGFIDEKRMLMAVFIVADADNGDYVIQIKGETIAGGDRIQIDPSEVLEYTRS